MKKLINIVAIGLLAMLSSFKITAPVIWTADKMHSKIGFSITHNMASDIEGSFKNFNATITTTGDDFTGSIFNFTAEAGSITTDNQRRDENIRGTDFLDVEKFPELTFKSTSVSKRTVSDYIITGNLTLHGVTKPVVLTAFVRIPPITTGVRNVAGFKITGIIKRSEYGIGSGFANVILGDEITLSANGEFGKK